MRYWTLNVLREVLTLHDDVIGIVYSYFDNELLPTYSLKLLEHHVLLAAFDHKVFTYKYTDWIFYLYVNGVTTNVQLIQPYNYEIEKWKDEWILLRSNTKCLVWNYNTHESVTLAMRNAHVLGTDIYGLYNNDLLRYDGKTKVVEFKNVKHFVIIGPTINMFHENDNGFKRDYVWDHVYNIDQYTIGDRNKVIFFKEPIHRVRGFNNLLYVESSYDKFVVDLKTMTSIKLPYYKMLGTNTNVIYQKDNEVFVF